MKCITIQNEWYKVVFKDENKVVIVFSGEGYHNSGNIGILVDYISKPNVSKVHLIFDAYYCNYTANLISFESRLDNLLGIIYKFNSNVRVFIHIFHHMLHRIDNIKQNGIFYKRKDIHYIPTVLTDINSILWFRVGNDYTKIRYLSIKVKHDKIIVCEDCMTKEG